MKLKYFFVLGVSIFLVACGNTPDTETTEDNDEKSNEAVSDANNESHFIKPEEIEEGWINYDGELGGNINYLTTHFIEYIPGKTYTLNTGAYISYYNNDEFIKTVLHEGNGEIPTVEEGDNIRLSFDQEKSDRIELEVE